MEDVKLGANGPRVSRLALGTWTFAGGSMWGTLDRTEALRAVRRAVDLGVTFFDSAPTYGDGESEEILGEALAEAHTEVTVATKARVEGLSPQGIRELLGGSLRRLRRERIDLMQIHWPASDPVETTRGLEELSRLQEEGLIGYLGGCNFGIYDLAENSHLPLVSDQLPYSLLWRVIEEKIVDTAQAQGLGIITYSTLLHGLLAGKYQDIADFPDGRARTRHFGPGRPQIRHEEDGMEPETQRILDLLWTLAEHDGTTPRAIAMQFALSRGFVSSVLFGARNAEQVEQTVTEAFEPLPPELLKRLVEETEILRAAAGGNPDMYQTDSRIRYGLE